MKIYLFLLVWSSGAHFSVGRLCAHIGFRGLLQSQKPFRHVNLVHSCKTYWLQSRVNQGDGKALLCSCSQCLHFMTRQDHSADSGLGLLVEVYIETVLVHDTPIASPDWSVQLYLHKPAVDGTDQRVGRDIADDLRLGGFKNSRWFSAFDSL